MNLFEQYPEFIESDTRQKRTWSNVSAQSLANKHQVALPADLVRDKTVLDLGCCLAATGQWVLAHGCAHYTGVDVQRSFVDRSQVALSKHWPREKFKIIERDVREFISTVDEKYDVVIVFGILYAFLDTFNLLEDIAKITKEVMVVDVTYPRGLIRQDMPMIEIYDRQPMICADAEASYVGMGARIAPKALELLMGACGFASKEGILYPEPREDGGHDPYNHAVSRLGQKNTYPYRYMMRFYKSVERKLNVGEIVSKQLDAPKPFCDTRPQYTEAQSWKFDERVASTFQQEAARHIPDYQRVVELCYSVVANTYHDKRVSVLDVGSALGHTMERFIREGYPNVWGVDNSPSMIDACLYPDRTTLSSTLPNGKWDVILANWTLHFVQARQTYIETMFEQLNDGGMLIITDKMDHVPVLDDLYDFFKKSRGVTDEEIKHKKAALQGVLTTKPLSWYTDLLKRIGAQDIQVINTCLMFHTIMARKF